MMRMKTVMMSTQSSIQNATNCASKGLQDIQLKDCATEYLISLSAEVSCPCQSQRDLASGSSLGKPVVDKRAKRPACEAVGSPLILHHTDLL